MKKLTFLSCMLLTLFLAFSSLSVSGEHLYSFGSASKDLYNEQVEAVEVFNKSNNSICITDNDIYLMSQVVYAESCGEPDSGKLAVASVILNRASDSHFPKSISGVINQKNAFSCVKNGKVYHNGKSNVIPDSACYTAVLDALKGKDPTYNAVFYYNPEIATSGWMKSINKTNIKTIGNHVFFVVK
ncbi:cell wall hydrolase [Clostridium estertheticum]|uniref:cell wall hydrolase n=1 Tax=Clostridium estertheticum TaxID=238834 RepID=UPI001CF44E4B|nr:cell wall hydrolase [Clostridium estertheticum]MCB2306729.1 cell wall hydrolase [Clostridium estertheticum]MCB2346672.1 cell wall hydrolase [Clostridium estertheticum]MCB2350235.1 cell wall hydrolase [Clostridium estertheticum]WAG47205.1 cell wall hydrolase [Clostridium estertheticum]